VASALAAESEHTDHGDDIDDASRDPDATGEGTVTALAQAPSAGLRLRLLGRRILMSEYLILYLCIALFAVLYLIVPRIASPYNIGSLLSNMWPLLVVAIGQTLVLIIAGIDLSQGAVISLTSVIGAAFIAQSANPIIFEKSPLWGIMLFEDGAILHGSPLGIPVAIGAMLLVGLLIGAFNGVAVAFARIPPFMVTLVTSMFFAAMAILLAKSENIIDLPDTFAAIGDEFGIGGEFEYFSVAMVIAVTLGVITHLVLGRTMFGRWLYGIGNNTRAAVVSGVPVRKVIVLTYMFSGFCAALASVIYTARVDQGRPTLGDPFLLDIIAAVVIGGTSLSGGKGKILWTFFGVVFLTLLGNALSMLNVPFFYVAIVKGSVILFAALIDVARRRIALQSA
jgi:ribose/xylose/arabinose/galactoside ABC-type transport system permease subunit